MSDPVYVGYHTLDNTLSMPNDARFLMYDPAKSGSYNITGALLKSQILTNPAITGGAINNTAIGGTTPAAGAFTTLSSTGNTTLGDAAGDTTTFPDLKALQVTTPSRASIRPSLLLDFANSKALDPRITYTRASTATYYDGKTFAKAEENLLKYSQEFDNAAWTKSNVTVTANTAVAPDGTSTADMLTLASGSGILNSIHQVSGTSATNQYQFSVYVKAGTHNYVQLYMIGNSVYINFDVSTGVVGTYSGITGTITSMGSGWYRLHVSFTPPSTSALYFVLHLSQSNSSTRTAAWSPVGTETIYLWGAQLEQRSSVTAYTPTTTQPITNYIPQLMTAASGVPRFDHNPITGESLGLLIEESRANLLTYSEDFSNAAWTNQNSTELLNIAVAPDGTLTADQLVEDTATSIHAVRQDVVTTAAQHTFSAYLKSAGRQFALLYNTTSGFGKVFDLYNGVVGNGTIGTVTASIQSVGDGWYRCSITGTCTTASNAFRVYANNTDSTTASYTGDGTSGIYLWGAQLESGAFPTSYIKTEAAQVTRSADAASMTGTNFSSWYRQDQGTLYGEGVRNHVAAGVGSSGFAALSDGTASNIIDIYTQRNAASALIYLSAGGASQATGYISNVVGPLVNTKATVAYNVNDIAFTANAATPVTDSAALIPAVNRLNIGAEQTAGVNALNGTIRKIAYYPARLSNATLQSMTTP